MHHGRYFTILIIKFHLWDYHGDRYRKDPYVIHLGFLEKREDINTLMDRRMTTFQNFEGVHYGDPYYILSVQRWVDSR